MSQKYSLSSPGVNQGILAAGHLAPPPRTLVDVFNGTVAQYPNAVAVDNGTVVLTYEQFQDAANTVATELNSYGIGPGDRVGVRVTSGTIDLYVAIMGTLLAGAAYVPVDVDDPDERARMVFGEAEVAAIIGKNLHIALRRPATSPIDATEPELHHDAWIIFTSGSTGKPKGVAVSHRSAAGFVDAEARLFLQKDPLGPGDRVMAGLSVAFDASCEEMWLAWASGACLVPAPRSLVQSGMDLGPWMVANTINVVSTVPTLIALWPQEALDNVRLLILGGEACPPEIGERLATPTRELWNTYGPTEATVVSCAAQILAKGPVRIGLPLQGWDLAVVDAKGERVAEGESGELVIGGIGLARYLDAEKDAEKYAPMPTLGWERAYRSGDIVTYDSKGLLFVGRADEQIKLGGRRIELGEIDNALLALGGVDAAAAAVRSTGSGNKILVGYITVNNEFDADAAISTLQEQLPGPLVPRLAYVDTLPTRTSGKIDREALPWPLSTVNLDASQAVNLEGTAGWLQELWLDILGAVVTDERDDFFKLGGSSLTSAQLVSKLRTRFPEVTVADVYEHSSIKSLSGYLDSMEAATTEKNSDVTPVRTGTQIVQIIVSVLLRGITGLRWLVWIALGCTLTQMLFGIAWMPSADWTLLAVFWLVLVFPPGKILIGATLVRLLLAGLNPGNYPRGGTQHLRLWVAEQFVKEMGLTNISSAPFMTLYARILGAKIEKNVDLHAIPPVTGMLQLAQGASIEPEVDLSGYWIDGNTLRVGSVQIGKYARIGTRSVLGPGSKVGNRAEIAPGSAVFGKIPADEAWSGAPAQHVGEARGPWYEQHPASAPAWRIAYQAIAMLIGALPLFAMLVGVASISWAIFPTATLSEAAIALAWWLPVGAITGFFALMVTVWMLVRLLSLGVSSGIYPVQSGKAWQAWAIFRVLDEARTWLFPIYSGWFTPIWLRMLGAEVGKNVEASTVLLIPKLCTIGNGAFLADDTMLGMYELGGGWLRIEQVRIGKKAFLGNSGITAPGRKVPKKGLVAVLSAAPRKTKAKAGTSWLGSPPVKLPRSAEKVDTSRTSNPSTTLRFYRGVVEIFRIIPVIVSAAMFSAVALCWIAVATIEGWWLAALLTGLSLSSVAVLGLAITTTAKWLLVGRVRVQQYPLWSSFIWRNELVDTFVEVIAAPWFAHYAIGTPSLNLWLRSMGAKIGRGVWCQSYWLPEPDLITLEDSSTVNAGCVVQTHLFHDRLLNLNTVLLQEGATLGSHSVILPAASIGKHATVGPVSLVMRGEAIPHKTRWIGNPVGPWLEERNDLDRLEKKK